MSVLVDSYLKALGRASRDLPRARRDELVAQIVEHLSEALPPSASEAEIRTELDRLGPAAEIVAAEYERLGSPPVRGGALEWVAIVLLLIGGLVIPVVGWVVGVIMLWCSRVWSWREKLAGTLLVPGGLASFFVLSIGVAETCSGSSGPGRPTITHCTGGPLPSWLGIPLLALSVLGPIGMSLYLGRRITRPVAG